jgi:hypothetical protein
MSISSWPFLISRARVSGHRAVVIPQFIAGTPLAEILPQAAGADETPPGHAVLREISYSGAGPLTLVFRVFRATQADFGIGDGALLDSSSRPILAIEGLIIRHPARTCERAGLSQADLDHAHQAVVPSYQRFWQQDRHYQTETSTQLKAATPGRLLALHRVPAWKAPASMPGTTAIPAQRSAKRRIAAIAVAAVSAAAAAAVISHVLGGQPLTIGPLAAGLASCTDHGPNYAGTGDMVSQQCQPVGTSVTVRVFRFDSTTAYNVALKHDISAVTARAGPICPPRQRHATGSTPWHNRFNPHAGQRLYCGQIINSLPTYLWTAPTAESFAIATAPTYASIQQWWHEYNTPGP